MLAFSAVVLLIANHEEAYAAELAGVSFPSRLTQNDTTLYLNGLGLRTATFFSIKVYVAALYLEARSNSSKDILASSTDKRLILHFVRSLDKETLAEAWREGFEANLRSLAAIESRIDALCDMMPDVGEGDRLIFAMHSNSLEIMFNKKVVGRIEGQDFANAVLQIWLGPKPPNADLKTGLLGVSVE